MRRRRRQLAEPARQPHPDPRTELRLQRILGLQESIVSARQLITEYMAQMLAARIQQDKAAGQLRGNNYAAAVGAFQAANNAQQERIRNAETGIAEAQKYITECQELIAGLAAEMDDAELSYLYALPARQD